MIKKNKNYNNFKKDEDKLFQIIRIILRLINCFTFNKPFNV